MVFQENNHVVREAPAHMMPQTTTSTTQAPRLRSTSTSSPTNQQTTEYIPRGCVSKRSECTQKVEDCRTFTHRSVAQVFCRWDFWSLFGLDGSKSYFVVLVLETFWISWVRTVTKVLMATKLQWLQKFRWQLSSIGSKSSNGNQSSKAN